MKSSAEKLISEDLEIPTEFTVQICSNDGRLLSEYELTRKDHNVSTLAAAENRAVLNLSEFCGEHLVIVVSEETVTKLRQIHVNFIPANDDC